MEPNYVGANKRIDAMAVAWLFAHDYVFFGQSDVIWDGTHHAIVGAQINADKVDEIPGFMSNAQVYYQGIGDFLMTLEQDEELIVPRNKIHHGLHDAICEGDLTGITLFNLQACGRAFRFLGEVNGEAKRDLLREVGLAELANDPSAFAGASIIVVDERLTRGIPNFYYLVRRMFEDMRAYNGIHTPYSLVFLSVRNASVDLYLDQFDDCVEGAISESFHVETNRTELNREAGGDVSVNTDALLEHINEVPAGPIGAQGALSALTVGSMFGADQGNPLDIISEILPDGLIACLKMCARNLVSSDFFISTLGWLKQEVLPDCDASCSEASSRVVLTSLYAQAYKGAEADELELMKIAAMDAIIDLNDASKFADFEGFQSVIEGLEISALDECGGEVAVATKFVDAFAAAYWNPVTKLVDALIEVVRKKGEQEHQEALAIWQESMDSAKKELSESYEAVKQARAFRDEVRTKLSELEKELRKAESEDDLKRHNEGLLAEAKQAAGNLAKVEIDIEQARQEAEANERLISNLRDELEGLGLFALDKKKSLRQEIERLEGNRNKLNNAIAERESAKRSLEAKANQCLQLEQQLAEYPESRTHGISLDILDAKNEFSWANAHLEALKSERSRVESQLKACKAEKPNYSEEAAIRPLLWRSVIRLPSAMPRTKVISGIDGNGYRKAAGSTWRDRRPDFDNVDPVHIRSHNSFSDNGSGYYSSTISYSVDVDKPDMIYRLDMDIEGPESAFAKANAFLADAAETFKKRRFTGRFSFMSDYECGRLPFTSIDTRLYVPEMDTDESSAALGLLAELNKECPQLSIDGIMEMVRSYAGLRDTYHVTSVAGDDTITAEQKVEGL